MKVSVVPYLLLVAISLAMPVLAEEVDEYPSFSMGGLLFGDLYHVASHHSEEGEGASGLVMRRAYLTFDANFNDRWFGRIRFEANQSGEFETYDFEGDFKDVYLGLDLDRHKMLLGLQPTPTFDLIESIWGLRSLLRTPMDLQGVASRDTGIAAKGPLNASGSLSYRAMYAANVDFGKDSNANARWLGALSWKPALKWVIDLYAGFEERVAHTDRSTKQIFAGYQTDTLRWGVQYSHQDRQDDPTIELASAFIVGQVSERISLIGRVDRLMEPSPRGDDIAYLPFDPSARATLFIAGLEFRPATHFRITPNMVTITYDRNDQGVRPETDVHIRLTLFLDFE